MEVLNQLYDNFRKNFDALDENRRAEVLLYTQAIKLSKLEEFQKRERSAFEMVKNLFTFPGRFNKEQLELFATSFVQNTQACMTALEKGGSPAQLHDMENKLFASLVWALTFGCGFMPELKSGVEEVWELLLKEHGKLKTAFSTTTQGLALDQTRIEIMKKASTLTQEEVLPQLSL